MTEPREYHIDLDGRRLAVMEWGKADGVPLVALHGWLDNAASFTLLAQLLPEVRLIAPDLAGHGRSDHRAPGQPYYIWDNVADVLALLDALKLQTVALLGHSMGASVATLLAGAFPERVSRLFLLDGLAPRTYAADTLPEQMAAALKKGKRIRRRGWRPYASFDDALQARMSGRYPVSREAAKWLLARSLKQTADGWCWQHDIALSQPSVVRLCDEQVAAFLQRLSMPVLLLMAKHGNELEGVRPLLDLVPDLTLQVLDGGHHMHLEHEPAASIAGLISERLAVTPVSTFTRMTLL
ncbi:alpha/beta fold hydrolase [Oceanimonas baumannii]|uniref:Alpha/beta hydrolase n=1 Tax=Oceanimonas baumannii TaxID=129578 RepID=A0A235CN45_9GAMM|nr:alpha/beta hydrolase [Oceanimonas baumannii]OYD25275.1 alpha/beta hydrolase [Oceanimonas baumannii]TDW62430.1 pimeloyl-ACP methyl ester carboxylesterase [Oceanimonas baumannii]